MPTSTVTDIIDVVRIVAWPLTLLVVLLLFRRQIADRVGAIRKAQLPGGISFELDVLEKEIVRTPELEATRKNVVAGSPGGVLPADRSYTVAEARFELERGLRRLSFAVSRDEEFATRNIEDLLLDLRSSGELSPHVSRQASEFMRLSAAAFSADLSDDDVVAFHTVGSLLAAHVNYIARVVSITTGLWGHDLFFMIERPRDLDPSSKVTWAAVATILPEVAYDYRLFRDAILRASVTRDDKHWPKDSAPLFTRLLVTEDEFLEIVIFRRNELRRVLKYFDRTSWLATSSNDRERIPEELYYRWPNSWGKIPFNTPVTGHTSRPLLPDVADDLLRAEEAVRRMKLTVRPGQRSGL